MMLDNKMIQRIHEVTQNCYKGYMLELEKVLTRLNLKCFEADFQDDNISGQIEKKDSGYHIYVNQHHSPNRQRFTIAHEIGHYLSFLEGSYSKEELMKNEGYEDYAISFRKNGVLSKAEKEANEIAAEMLMPQRTVENLAHRKLTPEQMASLFFVSTSAMTMRLSELYPQLLMT